MPDSKISDLAALLGAALAAGDDLTVVDVSDTSMAGSGTNKKITVSELIAGLKALSLDAAYQPLDSDLTAIAALTTTSYGRAFLALADAAAGRTALGLGTASTSASGDFQPIDSDLTALAALSTTSFGRALLELADAAAGRTALGLGTAATHAHGDYDVAGAAAAAQAASQPVDSDLTAIAALTTTSFGRSLLEAANAAALRTLAGLGSLATASTIVSADITDGTIVDADINASAAIAQSKIATLVSDLAAKAPLASPTFTGITTAPEFSASGLTGAVTATRYVGGTAGGPPSTGTFVAGDFVITTTGGIWICTTGGSPGTWANASAGAFVRKTSDETVTSSTALQDDNELLLALAANATYTFEALLFYDGATTGDLNVAFTVPAGATLLWAAHGITNAASSTPAAIQGAAIGASGTGAGFGGSVGSGTKMPSLARGLVRTAGTAGNLTLQWAQVASSGTATTVFADSHLSARRVA